MAMVSIERELISSKKYLFMFYSYYMFGLAHSLFRHPPPMIHMSLTPKFPFLNMFGSELLPGTTFLRC